MAERPEKLVQELIKKTFDIGVMDCALSLMGNTHDKEWLKSGWKTRNEAAHEIEELAEKIVSRMAVNGDV